MADRILSLLSLRDGVGGIARKSAEHQLVKSP